LHYRRWTFVEEVNLDSKRIHFKFNPSSATPGPFLTRVVIQEATTGDEYFWEDRPRYYAALTAVRRAGEDLSDWLEYCAEGLQQTLERVWLRVQAFNVKSSDKLVLRPKQERLLQLLRDHRSLAPTEIWEALDVSRQGAMDLLRPLIEAGLVEKVGTKKSGRYVLRQP
jgi:Fic family protein